MLINFDCSCLWYEVAFKKKMNIKSFFIFRVKDKYSITQAFSVDPVYLQYMQMDKAIDYRVILNLVVFIFYKMFSNSIGE